MQYDLLGVYVAGLLTFASPCVLPLAPIYLSVLASASVDDLRSGTRTLRAVGASLAFSAGLSIVFVGLGLTASAVGSALLEHRVLFLQLGGLLVFLFGLKFLGYLHVPWLERETRPALARLRQEGGLLGAFLFGAAFGLGWTPCIGPVLGAVLTYTASTSTGALTGAGYLGVYALGLSSPLVLAAAAAPFALRWHRALLPYLRHIEVATGVLLTAFGLLLLTDTLAILAPSAGAAVASEVTPSEQATCSAAGPAVADARGISGNHPAAAANADDAGARAVDTSAPGAGATCEQGSGSSGCALPEAADIDGPHDGANGERRGNAAADAKAPVDSKEVTQQLEHLTRQNGPRLIEFISRSCPICQRMVPVLHAAERDCAGQGVELVRIDVGSTTGRALAGKLRVRGVPTFVFLDGGGLEVARLVGEQSLSSLKQSLEVLSGQQCDGFRELVH